MIPSLCDEIDSFKSGTHNIDDKMNTPILHAILHAILFPNKKKPDTFGETINKRGTCKTFKTRNSASINL